MTALLIVVSVLAVFWLLGRIRLGCLVQYDEDGLLARLIAGPLRITLFPRKEKPLSDAEKEKRKAKERKKQAKKEAKKKEKPPIEGKERKGGALPPFAKLLPLIADAAGGLRRRLRIDELTLHLTWTASDPAETALGYGRANAIMGMIWPLFDHNFNVKKHDLGVAVDFNGSGPVIMCRAALTIRFGQLLAFVLRLGIKFLAIWSRNRRCSEKQEA